MAGAWAAAARTQVTTMAGAWSAAARQAGNLSRFSSPSLSATQASKLIQRRGLSGGGDHDHDPPRVNVWKDPMSLERLKEVQFALLSFLGWGLLIYGGHKLQQWQEGRESCGKKEEKAVVKA